MSFIQVEDLTFAYHGSYDNVFERVRFRLDTDWRLGFIGRNGRGKTTFLKLLMGAYPYSGSISASVSFAYFPWAVSDEAEHTMDVLRSFAPGAADWEICRELSLLDVAGDVLDRPFGTLSQGEQTKALLAAMFLREGCFPLIDEPTNHLDLAGRRKLAEYLGRKRGFILVSHDRELLDACVDHILAINRTTIQVQQGNFSTWWANRQMQEQYELAENRRLQGDIRRLSAASRQTAAWSDQVERSKKGATNSGSKVDRGYVGHKAAKMMKRSKAIQERRQGLLEEKKGLLRDVERSDRLSLSPMPFYTDKLLEVSDLAIQYGAAAICRGVRFQVKTGDRVVLQGRNGTGKSSILRLICGEDIPHTGTLCRSGQLVISYVPQSTDHLRGDLADYARGRGLEECLFKAILRKLGVEQVQFEKDMAAFSAGQKKKVLLAASLCQRAHLYVWDEPLNYLDVIARMQLEELLMDAHPTMLLVEHDGAFCSRFATETVELRRG